MRGRENSTRRRESVILQPPDGYDRPALLRAHGRAVESLEGRYVTSVDIGTCPRTW
jgi:leucine dehydrogenase